MQLTPDIPVRPKASPTLLRNWQTTAWVAGVFSLLVGLVMLVGYLNRQAIDPLKSPELKEAKTNLRLNPNDEAAKQHIRGLDLRNRQNYFQRLSRMNSGVYLLLGGLAVFVVAVGQCGRLSKQPPMPQPLIEDDRRTLSRGALSRWSVAATGALVGTLLFVVSLGLSVDLPKKPEDVTKVLGTGPAAAGGPSDAAPAEELRQNWPRFRGPGGNGVSSSTNAPLHWDVSTGENVAWKTPAPAKGFNSPLVWGNRLFLSAGDANRREVFCLDTRNGRTLWQQAITNVPGSPAEPPEIPESTGYAAGTMATDGRRVYAMFANGDLAALTMEGKVVWSKGFGAMKNPYGYATSLATWQDRVMVQLDQGESEEGKSRLYALDGKTGQILWQRPRKVGASWASPIVIEAAGKAQIITLAVPWVIAYAATDGSELWRVECLSGEVTPSPVFAGGMVLIASPSEKLVAIRPDGQGDVTKTHVAWTAEDNVPDVTSPVSSDELTFAVTTAGMLTCFDAKDGKKLWEHDFELEVHASPTLAGNRLYLLSQKGTAIVVEAARQFKELYRTQMGDAFHASPALVNDHIFLRGVTNIWCLGPPVQTAAQKP